MDEIALNPAHFQGRTTEEILSTLVHEMVHQWQAWFGKPSRSGYHNKEWADKMESVGLMPSDTGQPGGRRTGQKVTHYIVAGGSFERVTADLIASGFAIELVEFTSKPQPKKRDSKTRYQCPGCHTKAWAKPDVKLTCDDCDRLLIAS